MRRIFLVALALGLAPVDRAQGDAPPAGPPPPPQDAAPADPPPPLDPPVIERFVPATYPPEALAAGLEEAVVVLEIVVTPDGRSADVKVVGPAGHGFDEAAVAAARQFVWRPGRVDGRPVQVRVTYEYRFTRPTTAPSSGGDVGTSRAGDRRKDGRAGPGDARAGTPGAGGAPAATSRLEGVVRERGTRRPLAGVVVAALAAGEGAEMGQATTDPNGRFALDLPPGRYHVVALLPGHARAEFDETLGERQTLEVTYRLDPDETPPYTTTIEGEPLREEVERRSARLEEAERIAGTRGDPLRVIETMPGVARPPLGFGVLVVRGSNPEDTTALIAGHQVYLLYHFGGITSVVNPELLERIDFLPGNFSARYGRAIGGVVEVDLREPRRDGVHGHVDANLIDTSFLLEGPIGRGGLAVAGRRSYVDFVLGAALPDDAGLSFRVAPRYWDWQVLFHHPLAGGTLDVTAFGFDDKMRFLLDDPAAIDPGLRGAVGAATSNHRVHARWARAFADATRWTADVGVAYGGIEFAAGPTYVFDLDAVLSSYRFELERRLGSRAKLWAGYEGQLVPFHVRARGARPPQEGDVPAPPSTQEILETDKEGLDWRHGAYLEAELDLGRGVFVTPGVRADHYLLTEDLVVDPRLGARWVGERDVLRAGLGLYTEHPQEYESDPTFGNPAVRPERALHASVGYDRQLSSLVRVETTLFYKRLWDLIVTDTSVVTLPDGTSKILGLSNDGVGRVYGVEWLLRHDVGRRFFGWLSYTLSRSERRDHPGKPYRPFSLDQTHILTLVGSVRLPWRLRGGARLTYVTGNPHTPILGSFYDADADVYVPIPGEPNSDRMPAFHQLDLRIEREFVFDAWKLTAYLDVTNVYNRANPEAFQYSYDYRERQVISGLPILPSLGVRGEF